MKTFQIACLSESRPPVHPESALFIDESQVPEVGKMESSRITVLCLQGKLRSWGAMK